MAVESPGWSPPALGGSLSGIAREGPWELSDSRLRVDATGIGAWLALTSKPVRDFDLLLSLLVVPRGNASIFFRQQPGAPRYYQFDLRAGTRAAVVSKVDGDAARPQAIHQVNLDLPPGSRQEVLLVVRGDSITTQVGGRPVNQVLDGDFPAGHVCLTAWNAKAEFGNLRIRILDEV